MSAVRTYLEVTGKGAELVVQAGKSPDGRPVRRLEVKNARFLTDADRAAVEVYHLELVWLAGGGVVAARALELAERSALAFAPDGTRLCAACGAPAIRDGCGACAACAVGVAAA